MKLEWHEISTAPNSGEFLVKLADGTVTGAVRVYGDIAPCGVAASYDMSGVEFCESPVSWMPLP